MANQMIDQKKKEKKRYGDNEYPHLSFKDYVVTTYKSKLNGKKDENEILKYIPSKQRSFTLYATDDNENDNDFNKGQIVKGKVMSSKIKKDPNNISSKQTYTSMDKELNNNLIGSPMKNKKNNENLRQSLNFLNYISSKNYNNSRYQKKLSNIAKLKNELMNDNISGVSKKKRRKHSLLSTDPQEIEEFENKIVEKKLNNKNGVLKNNKKKSKEKKK